MSRVYDSWEKLVGAVLDREKLRQLAYSESLSSSITADFSSHFSFGVVHSASRISSETFYAAANFSHPVKSMKFKEIKKATKDFHHKMWLGEGAFGPVFKGWIHEDTLSASKCGSGMAVAVKKWRQESSLQGHQEWVKEINYLSQLRHPNLVKLIGYCSEEDNLILVYEFIPKGSLNNHLFTKEGINHFLGRLESKWLKVLLEPSLSCMTWQLPSYTEVVRVAGRARDGPTGDMTHVSTRVVGTYGIVAPEYAMTGHLTEKSDVYSFGIVLLELLTGRRVSDLILSMKGQNLVDWAKQYSGNKTKISRVMDTRLHGQYPHSEAYTIMKLACQCLSTVPEERPRMDKVVLALEQLQRP